MDNAVGRLTHALDASREEQGLCPHVKNPAFDAGMVFFLAREAGFEPEKGLCKKRKNQYTTHVKHNLPLKFPFDII